MDEQRNAAAELYELLSDWEQVPAGASLIAHRAGDDGDWWPLHVRAANLLDEVTVQARRLRPGVGLRFEAVIGRLRDGIFVTGQPMVSTASTVTSFFRDEDLAVLQMMQYAATTSPAISGVAAADLLAAARQAEDLVTGATHLDEEARRYLLDLSTHLSRAVQQISTFGGAEVRRLACELSGSLGAYFGDAPADEHDQAAGLVRRLLGGVKNLFVQDFAPTAVKAIAGTADQWILPPGAGS